MRGRKFVNVVESLASCVVSELQRSCCFGGEYRRETGVVVKLLNIAEDVDCETGFERC